MPGQRGARGRAAARAASGGSPPRVAHLKDTQRYLGALQAANQRGAVHFLLSSHTARTGPWILNELARAMPCVSSSLTLLARL
jgi:hypothetical protein